MKKEIIALYGAENIGKTTTLTLLINHLKKYYFCEKHEAINQNDSYALFNIKAKKIGITTIGDWRDQVSRELNNLINLNCDIIVTATRTRGGAVDVTEKLGKKNEYSIRWIDKTSGIHHSRPRKDYFIDSYNRLDMEYILEYILHKTNE